MHDALEWPVNCVTISLEDFQPFSGDGNNKSEMYNKVGCLGHINKGIDQNGERTCPVEYSHCSGSAGP